MTSIKAGIKKLKKKTKQKKTSQRNCSEEKNQKANIQKH
jgi:hypothetical protein